MAAGLKWGAKVVHQPIQQFHRTHRTPFRLLLSCAALLISGCVIFATYPYIHAIAPDLCKRQIVSIGDEIVSYTIGVKTPGFALQMPGDNPASSPIRSGRVYYGGMKDETIKFDHERWSESGYVNLGFWASQFVNLKDINNYYWTDGTKTWRRAPLGHRLNAIGLDGEAYIYMGAMYYMVVYSASPEELDYALQETREGFFGWEPVPCPEP
jgi:hypothetical protein